MKKLFGLLSLLVLVAACSSPPTNRNGVVASTNKAAETKPTASVSEAEMEVREKATWEALEKKNYGAFADMLANDYLEVGDDGIFDKTALVNYLKDLNTSDTTFADWKMLPLDKDAVILMYSVTIKGTFKGQAIPPGPYRASSAWVNREGKWLAIYYQQTAVNTTPHPPPPSADQLAKAASPAAKIAEAGPDPIANEKAVWDTFRSRNYDAFAAFLAPDLVEVEADAVYDKAGAVKGVAMFDASKAELSDWKAVKINNDAALVSYVYKFPGAPRERHSSIWINRNGKWMALFHQGTPEAVPAAKPAATKPAPKAVLP
jgi:hypothetical protein